MPSCLHQGGGDVVLRAQRVGGAEAHIGPAGLEGFHEVGGFGRHMEAGSDPNALERLFPFKSLSNESQDRHGGFGPFDLQFALIC